MRLSFLLLVRRAEDLNDRDEPPLEIVDFYPSLHFRLEMNQDGLDHCGATGGCGIRPPSGRQSSWRGFSDGNVGTVGPPLAVFRDDNTFLSPRDQVFRQPFSQLLANGGNQRRMHVWPVLLQIWVHARERIFHLVQHSLSSRQSTRNAPIIDGLPCLGRIWGGGNAEPMQMGWN